MQLQEIDTIQDLKEWLEENLQNIELTTAQWTALEWYFRNKREGEGK